jgi:hypothetical protein
MILRLRDYETIWRGSGVKHDWRFAQKLIDRGQPRHRGHCSAVPT